MEKLAAAVLVVSVLTGAAIGLTQEFGLDAGELAASYQGLLEKDSEGKDSELVYGTAHDHALFYMVVNGSERSLTSEKFQLNSRYVHLENNRSHIVHKHAEGVTWKKFFETINVSVERKNSTRICVSVVNDTKCGEGRIVLDGRINPSLDTEIEQGSNLLIIMETENWRETARDYMERQLPREYKPQQNRGYRI